MGAAITLAGADLIAQKQVAQEGLDVVRFIFANVPGLNHAAAVDRAAGLPPAEQIVHTAIIPAENKGYVNPNQVVYSVQVGSDVGDWDFNWIGLETAEGVLFAVSYVPLQQKRRNIPPLQIGNNITRNFLVVFDGAQVLTGITIDASTWQHDFTVRLAGIDERERQSNRDIYGRACFFGSALQLEKVGDTYQLKPGTAYVEGVRLQRSAALPVVPPAFPTTAWLDVALQRELSDVVASWSVVWGAGKVDYVDSAGVQHYCVAIADLPNSNTITDSRPVENIAGPLVVHFAARVGDYAGLRARATTKGDVGLGNLPNAKSDDPDEDDSEILATTKALRAAILRLAQPFDALSLPTIGTPTNRLNVTAATDVGTGGRISVPAGVPITLAQEVEAGKTARPAGFTTAAWTSAALDTNSTYFLRAQVSTDGALVFYMQKGTDTDTTPASLKGTAGGIAGGGFDSTVLDMLVAKVVTGITGSMPSVISLANAQRLFTEFSSSGPAYASGNNAYFYQQSFTINWARRPTAVPVFAAVSQIGISKYVEGGANYARLLAVTRYSIDCTIATDWHTVPTSPYGAIDGTAAA